MNNLHPIFVHFPIAMLTVYSLLELAPMKRFRESQSAFHIKLFLLVVGIFGAMAAFISSEPIEHMFDGIPKKEAIVELHSFWATATMSIYGALVSIYAIEYIKGCGCDPKNRQLAILWELLKKIQTFLKKTPILVILALLGLVAVSVTGALGGALVHGTDVDPFVNFVYRMHAPFLPQ